ncbi:MAG: hypothetical protein ACHQK8_03610, partial [Bacteroidia bacterium]
MNCFAQDSSFSYPSLQLSGNNVENFVPQGWKIIKKMAIDFNTDRLIDAVVVLQTIKPFHKDNQNYFPKILFIVKQISKNDFQLNLQTHKIFGQLNWFEENDETFVALGKTNLHSFNMVFRPGGSLNLGYITYYFEFRNSEWILTKYLAEMNELPSKNKFVRKINFTTGREESFNIIK